MTADKDFIVGIDLGTTNSLVAVADHDGARILMDGESSLIPSEIFFDESGRVHSVGHRARTLRSIDPRRVVYSVKRLMGRGKSDISRISLPFDFSEASEEMIRMKVGSRVYTPIELSAEILKRCKFVAENTLGGPVKKAVITVPAYFNDSQRSATTLAARLAGFQVSRILNEPTAAALAFGLGKSKQQEIIIVYDFGGGTFDVSVLKVTDGVFEVVSTAGDTELGGDDMDAAIYEWLSKQMKVLPQSDDEKAQVMAQIENLKKSLTEHSKVEFRVAWANEVRWSGVVRREDIETIVDPIIARTLSHCEDALQAAKIPYGKIDHIVLVGGSTKVPLVAQRVEEFFGRAPYTSLDPEQAVALGAAIQGSILAGELKGTLLLDVVPLSLGLETMGGVVTKIIPRNSTIPVTVSEKFTTYADNQTGVDLHIVQGERELVQDCRSLGRFKLKIRPAPAGIPKIEVKFLMDANGILKVQATELAEGVQAEIEVRPSFGLSDAEVEKMLEDAWLHAEKDFEKRAEIEAKNQAEALLLAVKKSLKSPFLSEERKTYFEKQLMPTVQALETDLAAGVTKVILLRTKELDQMTQELSQEILQTSLKEHLKDRKVSGCE